MGAKDGENLLGGDDGMRMTMASSFVALLAIGVYMIIPAFILYFIVKAAIKNAISELKDEGKI